ncbi:MAG: glutathione peroxidase [Chitinophagales bacterium]|nr:glutathione peroxidase [Chitinophagales bacterium]
MDTTTTLHAFSLSGLTGGTIDFSAFKGKKVLIVNTASFCGYTPQYKQLKELQEEFSNVLVVVGVPCNDFGNQEPDSDAEIAAFCERNFQVNFPMTTKVTIVGDAQHPLYQWLTSAKLNGVQDAEVKWNFHKFLIDENGHLMADFPSSVSPVSEDIINLL